MTDVRDEAFLAWDAPEPEANASAKSFEYPGDSPANEALFEALGRTLQRLHRKEPAEPQLANIRQRFPTAAGFFEVSPYMLRRSGITNLDSHFFTMVPALARRFGQEAMGVRPKLNTLSRMAEYLKALFVGVHVECFYVVLLTATGILINAKLMQKGTTDSAPFYQREVLASVINREAKAVVLCHNHPGGTMRPSREDLICTLNMLNATAAMGIPMLDHVIIARDRAVSIRETGLLPDMLWEMQAPNHRLNKRWMDVELLTD